jgi:hypothetical protein
MGKAGLLRGLLLSALLAAPLLIAPPWIRGLAANKWVEHYASLDGLPRPRRASARMLVAKTDLAIRNLAPLPQASGAAIRALEIGQRLQGRDHDRETALIVYRGVRASCARVRSRLLSGAGFAVIEARAAALERAASRGTSR